MKSPIFTVCVSAAFCLCGALESTAQNSTNFPTLGTVVRMAPELDAVLDRDAKLEVLSSRFDWAEGPVWVGGENGGGYLLFSDIPPNRVMKWVEGEGVSVFLEPSGYTGASDYGGEPGSNGLILDAQGLLVSCEHGDRRLSVMTKDGGKRTLVDNFEGKRLNSPNDATYHSNGDLYFTDPPYGLPNRWEDPRRELDFCGVYRLSKEGKLTLLTKEMTRPNGIAFSPDEETLYVAQSDPKAALWKAFPVNDDGTLGEGRVFFDATPMVGKHKGLPDGLKVDANGNLWATGPGGVHILRGMARHWEGSTRGRQPRIAAGEGMALCFISLRICIFAGFRRRLKEQGTNTATLKSDQSSFRIGGPRRGESKEELLMGEQERQILQDIFMVTALAVAIATIVFTVIRRNHPILSWNTHGNVWTSPFSIAEALISGLVFFLAWVAIKSAPAEHLLPTTNDVLQGSLMFAGLACVVVLYFMKIRDLNIGELFGLRRLRGWRLVFIAVAWSIPAALTGIVIKIGSDLFVKHVANVELGDQMLVLALQEGEVALKAAIFCSAVFIAPVAEEILFRGLMYASVKRYTERFFAAIVSGLAFGLLHANLASFAPLVVLGMFFALAYEITGCLLVPILMHALFNAVQCWLIL